MRTTEFEAKKEQAVKLSVLWAKTGLRELSMRDAVNDYIEATGANHAIDNDEKAILYGKTCRCITSKHRGNKQS